MELQESIFVVGLAGYEDKAPLSDSWEMKDKGRYQLVKVKITIAVDFFPLFNYGEMYCAHHSTSLSQLCV